jgi:hypothetical protein
MIASFRSILTIISQFAIVVNLISFSSFAQSKDDCLMCHEDKALKGTKNGRSFSVFVDTKKLDSSIHSDLDCIMCHADLEGTEFPHTENVKKAQCLPCHEDAQKLFDEGIHGKAYKNGDRLAPNCQTCHGSHDIIKVNDPNSAVAPIKIPFLCGSCHKEGAAVQVQRKIPEDHILENYSESMHGDGLLKKGLSVAATCASCHSPHRILPHTDPRSTIAKNNIAATCTKCHMEIEQVHRKVIKGELWEKQAHVLPACVDCHQPHKIRSAFYEQGLADGDCLRCHSDVNLKAKSDGHSVFVDYEKLQGSMHVKVACSQCHTAVNQSKLRPCEGITAKVDCASCHAEVGDEYKTSTHGKLNAENNNNAPFCSDCHGTHYVLGKKNSKSPTFAPNIPQLCAKCHRSGEKAAKMYTGPEKNIINSYVESIHGKGLMKSGLTVTATCIACHTAHHELPHTDSTSSINKNNIAKTCGNCHYGVEEKFEKSVHSVLITKTDKELPVCNTCHSAHNIERGDAEGFRMKIMNTCGNCHQDIAKTYFDTFHGKVSQLGYSKTAKCYDCHGSHDILKVTDPESHLSRQNILATCQKCHHTATKQFAGYFTHATHHDPEKYPWLFWTFWGMTGLLLGTFIIAGAHTILWMPRSLQYKRELKKRKEAKENSKKSDMDTKE